jgi:hypothetical protein
MDAGSRKRIMAWFFKAWSSSSLSANLPEVTRSIIEGPPTFAITDTYLMCNACYYLGLRNPEDLGILKLTARFVPERGAQVLKYFVACAAPRIPG